MTMKISKLNSGNILFLILIAVALFAALSYAITSSSRTGESGIAKDKAKLKASELIQFMSEIENGVNRAKVINGCTDSQLSFYHSSYGIHAANHNPNAPSDFRCHIFHPSGGGVVAKSIEGIDSANVNGYMASNIKASVFPITNLGSDNSTHHLVMHIPLIDNAICEEIHNRLGLPIPVPADFVQAVEFTGSFSGSSNGLNHATMGQKRTFCAFHGVGVASPMFFHVLIAR